jgi:hypothetical protein
VLDHDVGEQGLLVGGVEVERAGRTPTSAAIWRIETAA